jgi:hypothetical protein
LPWLVIGGVAVIARGIPRSTIDVDATVSLGDAPLESLVAAFARYGIVPRIDDAMDFARSRQVLLMRHEATGVPIDVSLAWLPFELEAIAHGATVDWAGAAVRVPRADDLVIYKMVAARPRDLEDAEQLLALHGSTADLARIEAVVDEFAHALDDRTRPEILRGVLKRLGLRR